jgi:hypothetical protein
MSDAFPTAFEALQILDSLDDPKPKRPSSLAAPPLFGDLCKLTRARWHMENLKRRGLDPRRMTDNELMRERNLGKGIVNVIRRLASQAENVCPHCGGDVTTPPNAEVSDGGPLTHESTETRTRRSLH